MAKKQDKKSTKTTQTQSAQHTSNSNDQLIEKVRENYLSIALGLLVFLVAASLIMRANDDTANNPDAKSAEQMAVEKASENEYVVKQGDSVSSIAQAQLGSLDRANEIVELNKLDNPEKIEVGQKLMLPEKDATDDSEVVTEATQAPEPTAMEKVETLAPTAKPQAATTKMGAPITGTSYTVQKGDTLFTIAVRAYNDGAAMNRIMRANGMWNANKIEIGDVLKLPR